MARHDVAPICARREEMTYFGVVKPVCSHLGGVRLVAWKRELSVEAGEDAVGIGEEIETAMPY